MAVYLDDEAIDVRGADLAAVLQTAQDRLRGAGRIVVEVQLDGRALTGDDLLTHGRDRLDASELRLYSADPLELSLDALDATRARLAQAREAQSEAADLLQADKAAEALAKVAVANEAWLQTQQAVGIAAETAGIDLAVFTIDGEPVASYTSELVTALKSLRDQLARRDTVSLADALAYEWPTLTDRWDRLIETMIQEIERR